jgi:hypothetical protein
MRSAKPWPTEGFRRRKESDPGPSSYPGPATPWKSRSAENSSASTFQRFRLASITAEVAASPAIPLRACDPRPYDYERRGHFTFDSTFSLNAPHFFLLSAWCSWIRAFKASTPCWKSASSAATTSA